MKLLVVDTDRHMVEMLGSWLKSLGHDVYCAFTSEQAEIKWIEYQPDLVILDNSLGDIDALALCRDLQSKHDALILIMAEGKDTRDEVRCLESVADDYLHKPFAPSQLLARIHAVSRRARSSVMKQSSLIEVGPLCFNSSRNEVTIRGKAVRLTPTQGKLLKLLATNAGNVCTPEQIVVYIWGFSDIGDTSLIKSHIYHLRKKIELDPNNPRHILTVPGLGYTLVRLAQDELSTLRQNAADQLRCVSGKVAL
jgi:DNA-binding response OmpR family regulator